MMSKIWCNACNVASIFPKARVLFEIINIFVVWSTTSYIYNHTQNNESNKKFTLINLIDHFLATMLSK